MADDILSQYTGAGGDQPPRQQELADDTRVISGSLITLGVSVAAMLDLRFRDGKRLALPYGYITSVGFDPSNGIEVRMTDQVVTITGRHLLPVYSAITSHTALAIIEAPSQFDEGGDEPFVDRIGMVDGGGS